jgi:hypothetical protein
VPVCGAWPPSPPPPTYPLSDSMVMRARRESDGTFLAKLLKCRAAFVALVVNDNREFQNLYDRQAIDRRIAESIS